MKEDDDGGGEPGRLEAISEPTPSASSFLRAHREEILACWEKRVRTLPAARHLERSKLLDHLPKVLNQIADRTDELRHTNARVTDRGIEDIELFAIERLDEGFDLIALVMELGFLRSCITSQIERSPQPLENADIRVLDEVIDRTVVSIVDRYTRARDRTLQIFDRMATVALESRSLEELVQRLLQLLVQTSDAVHTATILTREEGDVLRARASVGLPEDASDRLHMHIGEGFAGRIAALHEPLELRNAASDPLVKSTPLRASGVRALYGLPLIESGEVIGVAHIGSMTADEFSIDDKRLLRAVAGGATAAIYQYMLRETAERSAAELRAREHELREREQEFRVLADNIPQLAWMADDQGRAYWFNQRWVDYTGATLEELRRTGVRPYHHPDHLPRVAEMVRLAIETGDVFVETFPLRSKRGTFHWFLSRAVPIHDEQGVVVKWFGTNTDITDQRFLDEATKLLNSSLDYDNTLQQLARLAVPDIADWCIVDLVEADGTAVRRVATAHVDPARIALAREWDRKYPPDWEAPIGPGEVIRTGRPVLYPQIMDEHLMVVAQNDEHLEMLRAAELQSGIIAPLQARGRTFGTLTLISAESKRIYEHRDLSLATELGRRAGLAVDNARLYQESQQALRDREDAVRSRDEVLAIVTHDLRSPLSAIGMSAALLVDNCGDPEASKRLALIQRSAERMEHMIDDLFDMATIRAGGLTLHRDVEDAGTLLADVFDAHQPKATSKGIELRREDAVAGVAVHCDRDRIERVFANLLGNALKYSTEGGVVAIRGYPVDGEVWFSVADTGPGIPAEQVPHLFEPYWTHTRHGSGKEGTGLGLYIAKGIIEAHGGQLWVDTTPSQGSEFFFTLPLAKHRSKA